MMLQKILVVCIFLAFIFLIGAPSVSSTSRASSQFITETWRDYANREITASVETPSAYYEGARVTFRQKERYEPEYFYFQEAIRELRKSSTKYLKIPRATYSHYGSNIKFMDLSNEDGRLNDKVLDFQNSTLYLNHPSYALFLEAVDKITIKNLKIIYRFPIASIGTIGKALDLSGNEVGYIRIDDEYFDRIKFPKPARLGGGYGTSAKMFALYQTNEDLINNLLWEKENSNNRIIDENLFISEGSNLTYYFKDQGYQIHNNTLAQQIRNLGPVGTKVIIKHYSYAINAVQVIGGSNIILDNIDVYGVPGIAYYLADVDNGVLIQNCDVDAKRFSDPLALFGSSEDGIHLTRTASNVIIRNNNIRKTGDDPINVFQDHLKTAKRVSGNKILLKSNNRDHFFGAIYSSDSMSFVEKNLNPISVGFETITNVRKVENDLEVTFGRNLSGQISVYDRKLMSIAEIPELRI